MWCCDQLLRWAGICCSNETEHMGLRSISTVAKRDIMIALFQGLLVNCNSIEQDWVSKVMREHFELEVSHLTATRMAEVGKQIEAAVCYFSTSFD